MNVEFWSIVASIATTLGAIVVVVASVIALRQLGEARRSRHLDGMIKVYELISSDQARSDRRFVYEELTGAPDKLDEDARLKIERICVTFDTVGRLVTAGLVPRTHLLSGHATAIARVWDRLEPHVRYRRDSLDDQAHAIEFENLASSAKASLQRL